MQERFQSCLKISVPGLRRKAGRCARQPAKAKGPGGGAAAAALGDEPAVCGLVLELRDCELDEETDARPLASASPKAC